uniref:Uncharacterized protein n=1 Tax=Nelumbo nucifera TaxID=4432 RepID=A0A822ZRR3_NELNU|nr:TPA_asm: hypothetical protein HUJ06_017500 [Nelumbo nucifera]
MRCQKHLSDLSSSVGVCASCLRERLFVLIAAQARAQAEECRKSDPHPQPLVFPRSVSPYVCRRSDDSSWHHNHFDQRFYSTPQVGPTSNTAAYGRKKKHSKFSLFTSLFTSRSDDHRRKHDPHESRISRASRDSISTLSSSPISSSWFSSILPGRRKKQSRLFSFDETTTTTTTVTGSRRPCRARDRGMSPAKDNDDDPYYEDYDGSPWASGYSSDASQSRRNHPHRLSTAASFCANRSRKLADFGKYNNYNP